MTRKEAIDKVYGMIGTAEQHEALDFLVPEIRELRESYERQVEDERIRKSLIDCVEYFSKDRDKFSKHGVTKEQVLAYIERQKEQKPVEKPSMLEQLREHLANTPKEQLDAEFEELKEFTIPKPVEYLDKDKIYAIMKKLHDLSFSKDILINSKEYKQIDEITHDIRSLLDYSINQQPTEWSEKDSLHLTNAILSAEKEWGTESYTAKWLKSLPERFNLSPNPTWSEEERKILDSIIDDYEAAAKSFCGYDGKIGLLRAIRDGEYGLSKQEWSKEDKDIIDEAAELVLGWGYPNLSAKLKSLSMKCLKSLDNWKPSEEQIVAFRSYIENFEEKAETAVGGWDNFNAMIQLYEQLKKLQSKSGKDDNG